MGRLNVRVVQAKGLDDVQFFGKSDPYVKVRCGNREYRTKTINNSQNPEWNEDFAFMIADDNAAQIHFELMDEEVLIDKSYGKYSMSVASLYRGEWADKWVLLNEHKGCGELNVMLQPEDFGKLRSEDEDPPQPDAQEEEAPAAGPIAVAAPAAVAEPVGFNPAPESAAVEVQPAVNVGNINVTNVTNIVNNTQPSPPPAQQQPPFGQQPPMANNLMASSRMVNNPMGSSLMANSHLAH
eukprot:CAMPEP_0174353288 /NCGR_PEP_ID=MMETSP0811_2-20130205/14081_1 /TAXON_ID=73025 ORGANISM="Eutreptiella gymnastica-like, Strain CCMP1594" /NCGR_SAMPLE_ID=MMETSP0811_2 /ASSEMBLY_ACC=CAM_ASM_000667 /LENGTH=238 /DNA_ID=CAMNT_0015483725 /DNA_START=22 /DNA_END=736 /DNA_ORIENTATION=-